MTRPLSETPSAAHLQATPPAAISVRGLGLLLVAATTLVAVICVAATLVREIGGVQHGWFNIIPMLDLDAEATFPAWYSAILLFIAGLLLCVIGWVQRHHRRPFAWHWLVMGIIFVVLSADECIAMHERIAWPIRRIFKPTGFLYFGWVIPGLVFVAVFVLGYVKFLIHLPPRSRRLFIASGAVFVGGALFIEMAAGNVEYRAGTNETAMYVVLVTIEELMEIAGITLFVYALLDHIRREMGGVSLVFAEPEKRLTTAPSAIRPPGPGAFVPAAPARPAVASPR